MVAAAVGIGSAVAGLGGSLISSNAAGNAAAMQARSQANNLRYQQDLLRLSVPVTGDLQNRMVGSVDEMRARAEEQLRVYGETASNALYGGAQNAFNALTGYAPQAVSDIRGGADRAIDYLSGAAQEARGYGGNAIDAILGGVNRGTNYLLGAAGDVRGALQPFVSAGQGVAGQLASEIGSGALGAMPSLTDFSQLPGYQFTLGQGLQAARNAASASGYGGLGAEGSGPLGKSLIQYSEGLANTFGNQYLQNYWANQNNRYNILANTANMGLNAGGALASNLANIYGNIGNIQSTGGANIATQYGNLNTLLANIAANQGNVAATAGANTGQVWQNLGNQVANLESTTGANASNLYSNIGSNLTNLGVASGQLMNNALLNPMQILAGIATGTATNFSNASTIGSGQIAQTLQNQGNLLGAGIAGGANSGLSNYLLYNALQPGGSGSVDYGGIAGGNPYA
jgi:hypothetical protein